MPPLSLYIHLPWCVAKCPYCDFNSYARRAALPARRYVDALIADLRREAERAGGREVGTVFLGGGTPSLFSPAQIGEILAAAASALRIAPGAEVTMEANPGSLERGRLADYRRAGVTRLSLGVQSFADEALRRLGRIHGSAEVLDAWREAEQAAFDSINLDLMYALPGQTLEAALADLRQALALAPQHVSWYQLTLEPNTVFHAAPPADLPDEDLAGAMEEEGRALLAAAGYEQYEVSAYALPGHRCRHNLNYWRFGDYLAAGAGAHGKLTTADGRIRRYAKPAHPLAYMEACEAGVIPDAGRELSPADAAFEFMLNAWRLAGGFGEREFSDLSGLAWSAVEAGVERARRLGLVESPAGGRWRPTARGHRYLNDLQAMFLPPPEGSG